MQRRRLLMLAGLAAPPTAALAQPRNGGALRVGVDTALLQSGLAAALQRAFGADTGIAVRFVGMPALPLLDALERGEFDVALANAPAAEAHLEQQGLLHDRREVARGEFVLVGPRPAGKAAEPAFLAGARDIAEALSRLATQAAADPAALRFLSAGDGSGTHVAEQTLWRAAKVAPAAPWYQSAAAGAEFVVQVRARAAYALVERGAWAASGGAGALLAGDPLAVERVHVMRSFRVNHPAGRIFVGWIVGANGRRVVADLRGYSRPDA